MIYWGKYILELSYHGEVYFFLLSDEKIQKIRKLQTKKQQNYLKIKKK